MIAGIRCIQPDGKVRAIIRRNELGWRYTTPSGNQACLEYCGIRRNSVERCADQLFFANSQRDAIAVLSRHSAPGFKYEAIR